MSEKCPCGLSRESDPVINDYQRQAAGLRRRYLHYQALGRQDVAAVFASAIRCLEAGEAAYMCNHE